MGRDPAPHAASWSSSSRLVAKPVALGDERKGQGDQEPSHGGNEDHHDERLPKAASFGAFELPCAQEHAVRPEPPLALLRVILLVSEEKPRNGDHCRNNDP